MCSQDSVKFHLEFSQFLLDLGMEILPTQEVEHDHYHGNVASQGPSTTTMFQLLCCCQIKGALTTEVSSLQRCPHYRGVLTIEVSSLQGCPHYRGVLTTEVSSLQGCPHYRGVLTTGVSSLQRCPHYRGVLTTEVSSLQGCVVKTKFPNNWSSHTLLNSPLLPLVCGCVIFQGGGVSSSNETNQKISSK